MASGQPTIEGVLLCKTDVTFETHASMNGRILAQTAAVLQKAAVTQPALKARR